MELLLILSGLPIFLLGYYIYKYDKIKESNKLLLKLFFGGFGSAILVLILTNIIIKIFPFFGQDIGKLNIINLLLYVFIKIALIEEFCKWFFTYIISFNNKEFDELYDGIVYSTFVALGFAFFENFLYVLSGGALIAIMRALTAVPLHACLGIIMGNYITLAKTGNKFINLLYSILIPLVLHGIYDFCIMSSNLILTIFCFIFLIVLFIKCIKNVKSFSK